MPPYQYALKSIALIRTRAESLVGVGDACGRGGGGLGNSPRERQGESWGWRARAGGRRHLEPEVGMDRFVGGRRLRALALVANYTREWAAAIRVGPRREWCLADAL